MASRSFHDLLLRARDDLAGSGRRSHALVVFLLALHLAVVAPFADADRRRAARESERQRLAEVGPSLDQLTQRLEQLGEQPLAAVTPALERLPDTLTGDLARLEATRWRLQQAAPTIGDDSATADAGDSAALRVDPPAGGVAPLTLETSEIDRIRQAENRYALLTVLEPVIERAILEPRFGEVNRRWQSNALPALESGVETANTAIPRLRERFPEGSAEWDALLQALGNLRRVARELQFGPPERPYWWASAETSPRFELTLEPTTLEVLRRPLALDQLTTATTTVRDRMAGLQGVWRARTERSETGERDLGSALASVGIDLAGFAPLFPLALGLVLAVVLLRRGLRLRQLAVVTRQTVDHGAPDALREWCLAEMAGSLRSPLAPSVAERRSQLRALGALLGGWAWLAAAGYQLHGPPDAGSPDWLPTLVAAGVVLVAVLHRLSVVQGIAQLLNEPGPGEDFFFDNAEPEATPGIDDTDPTHQHHHFEATDPLDPVDPVEPLDSVDSVDPLDPVEEPAFEDPDLETGTTRPSEPLDEVPETTLRVAPQLVLDEPPDSGPSWRQDTPAYPPPVERDGLDEPTDPLEDPLDPPIDPEDRPWDTTLRR